MNDFYLGNLAQIIDFMSEIADPNNEVEINFEDYKNENEITFW